MNATVALLGLGSMGKMLGRALAASGHDLTVWNRGAAGRETFNGICKVADTPLAAIQHADLVLMCLTDFRAAYEVLAQHGMAVTLKGKTLVQMSTATPDEARGFGVWAAQFGVTYLDAKIAVTPPQIGAPMTVIFYAGSQLAFETYEPVLKCLAGKSVFMGEALDRAVIGDFAFLSVYFAGTIGVLHGAAFCAAAGVDVATYFSLTKSFLHEIGERVPAFEAAVLGNDHTKVQSALRTDLAGAKLMAKSASRLGLHRRFCDMIIKILQDGVERGDGELDTSALVETFLTR
jgi:3-hydroxyisobutyrate dehydrogenase-like beta-hydroxyacid dehydrogenase